MTTPATHEPVSSPTALQAIVDEIATQLGETEEEPRRQIKRPVRVLGEERVRALVAQTGEIEAAGGLMLPNAQRRRTPGGVFFHLMRANIEHKEWVQDLPTIDDHAEQRDTNGSDGHGHASDAF